ncbi:MAG: hypothetical protein II567_14665, partial [Candidatus Riflebacteria bacterium]|nr:hypothetical protein [Candidatus Riflebacteria bacterium]
ILHEQNDNNMEIAVQIEAINNALDQLREKPAKQRKKIGYKQNNNKHSNIWGEQFKIRIIKLSFAIINIVKDANQAKLLCAKQRPIILNTMKVPVTIYIRLVSFAFS